MTPPIGFIVATILTFIVIGLAIFLIWIGWAFFKWIVGSTVSIVGAIVRPLVGIRQQKIPLRLS